MKRQCNIVVGVRGIEKEAPGAPEDEEQKQDSDGASSQVEVKKDLDLDHQISQIHVVATCVVAAFTQKKNGTKYLQYPFSWEMYIVSIFDHLHNQFFICPPEGL